VSRQRLSQQNLAARERGLALLDEKTVADALPPLHRFSVVVPKTMPSISKKIIHSPK
jgi:hypothetical protein